jgi:hypothetical protein
MIPKNKSVDRKEDSAEPIENQPLEWADEDQSHACHLAEEDS